MVHHRGRKQDVLLLVTWGVVSYHAWFHLFIFHDNHLKRHNISLQTPRQGVLLQQFPSAIDAAPLIPRARGDADSQSPATEPRVDTSASRYREAQLRLALVAKFAHEHPEPKGETAAAPGSKSKAPRWNSGRIGRGSVARHTAVLASDEEQYSEQSDPAQSSEESNPHLANSTTSAWQLPVQSADKEGGDAGATADGPSWHHRGTGVPGGVGQPQNSSVEQLYMLGGKHFHLHQAQFDQDGGRGGDVGNNGKARSAYLTYPVAKSNGSEEPTTYTFRAEDVNSLPLHDSQWSFSSCAIVSNSASMLKAQLGVEIDAHEAVWRINHAPINRFEKYVGSRTTFDVMNRPHVLKLSKMRKCVVRKLRRGQNASLVVFESTYSLVYYRLYSHLFLQFPFPGTVVVSPDLSQAIYEKWKSLASRWPDMAHSCSGINSAATSQDRQDRKRCRFFKKDCEDALCKPSTGFFTLLIAAQVCNKISMYGFESFWYSKTEAKKTRYHYFDDEEGETDIHSFELLMHVFEYLASHYPITISTPGSSSST